MKTSAAAASATVPAKPKSIDFTPGRRAIQQQHLDLRLDGVLTERYSLVVLPPTSDLSTASWTYLQAKGGEPARHVITFGPKLAEHQKAGDLVDYAASYHRHELAHSLWTERDLKSMGERCDTDKIPFGALNIFEDARIEHLWRDKFEVPFGWQEYEGAKGDPVATDPLDKRALAGLMAIIQNEGQVGILEGRLKDLPEAEEVKSFYDRMIAVEDTQDLFPLLNEWKTRFGFPPDMDEGSSKATGGDMKAGAKIQADAKEAGKLSKAEKEYTEEPAGMGALSSVVPIGQDKGLVLQEAAQLMEESRIKALADILRTAFHERERKISRATPAKRLNVRNLVLEREKVFRSKEKNAPGAVDLAVLFDCSGSMNGVPNDAGRHLVAALGQLAREGRVRGDLILTIGLDGKALNQVIPLRKVDSALASHISANGGFEGFDAAMRANRGRIKGRSLVVGYTDGHITDSEIDRKLWHQLGVYSIGCYVGNPESAANLGRWFDAPLCRSTETGLALALRDMVAARARQSTVAISSIESTMEREVEEMEIPAVASGRRVAAGI